MPSGEIWGENGPAAGALIIGLTGVWVWGLSLGFEVALALAALAPFSRHCFTYLGPPNGPIQRPKPVRYVQYECYEATARSEIRKLAAG
jgi:hypothetical protein